MDSVASRGRPLVASRGSGSGAGSGADVVDGDGVVVGAGAGADGRGGVGVDVVRSGSASACPEHPVTSASATDRARRPPLSCPSTVARRGLSRVSAGDRRRGRRAWSARQSASRSPWSATTATPPARRHIWSASTSSRRAPWARRWSTTRWVAARSTRVLVAMGESSAPMAEVILAGPPLWRLISATYASNQPTRKSRAGPLEGQRLVGRLGDAVDPDLHDRVEQRVTRGEVTVESARPDAGSLGDLVERGVVARARGRPRGRPPRCGRGCAWRRLARFSLLNGGSLRMVDQVTGVILRLSVRRPGRPGQNGSLVPLSFAPSRDRARTGVLVVLVAQLMLVLDATVVNVALPRIDADLGFGPASLSWVLNAYTLAFGGLLLLGGRLGDVRGRLRVFEAGLAVFVLGSLLGGLAPTPGLLVAARALQGVGAALAAPSVLALLTTSARDDAERNRALALFGAVSSGGASIGLLLGGLLTEVASWRWTLFINVPIGIAVLVARPDVRHRDTASCRSLRRRRRHHRDRRRCLARVGTDRHARARLDLRTHDHRLRRRRGCPGGTGRHRAPCGAPDDPADPAAQPHPRRRAGDDGAGRRRPAVDVLPRRAVRPARPRVRAARVRLRLPAVQPGHLHDVALHAATDRAVRVAAACRGGRERPHRRVRDAQQRRRRRHLPRRGLRADAARRAGWCALLHADHRDRAVRRRAGARRRGQRDAADHAAAR